MTSLQQTSAAEKWYYRDPQGEVQGGFHPVWTICGVSSSLFKILKLHIVIGPFLSGEMAEWFRAGYFTVNLLVKRSCDDRYSQLGDLIKIWGRIPFMPGPTFPPLKVR
jgi:PERQ amino acid-rich with GYF domain-containing protein